MSSLQKIIGMSLVVCGCLIALAVAIKNRDTIPVHHYSPDGIPYSTLHVSDPNYKTTYTASYYSFADEPALDTLQCPIPMECRVKNHTGIQCVFSSIEMLGRWAECKELIDPPITSRSDCKSYSGPSDAGGKLKRFGVKFEQTTDRTEGLKLIKKAMAEGRGCLWGVPGHAMVLVHYSEEEDRVCWVDNSDYSLKVQTTNIAGFNRRWSDWILVVYAVPDVIPYKVGDPANKIPIKDRLNPDTQFPKNYIPKPNKDEK